MLDTAIESYPQEKGQVRVFFEDEASFGRISDPRSCWTSPGERPVVHTERVREYRDVYGAVEPLTGKFIWTIDEIKEKQKKKRGRKKKGEAAVIEEAPKTKGEKSQKMNKFLKDISETYPNDFIICVVDGAPWHKSQYNETPENVILVHIPPRTPEMNPIEQIWREIRTILGNKCFSSIQAVIENLKEVFPNISAETVKSITRRFWFMNCLEPKEGAVKERILELEQELEKEQNPKKRKILELKLTRTRKLEEEFTTEEFEKCLKKNKWFLDRVEKYDWLKKAVVARGWHDICQKTGTK